MVALAAITLIVAGTLAGGGALLPGSVVQVPPQTAGFGVLLSAKPLKLVGASPPLNELTLAHFAPQKVTLLPTTAFRSPMTKLP